MTDNNKQGKILIVDDEEAIRFFIADALSQKGWETREAGSGEAALAALAQTTYDIILLDLRLGDMNGLHIMRQISKNQPAASIIIMTAYASVDSAVEAVHHGVFDYLRKPCDMNTIIDCINRAMAERKQRQSVVVGEGAVSPTSDLPAAPDSPVQTGELVINMKARTVLLSNRPLSLTPTEYEILALLAHSLGQPLSLEYLIHRGLGYDPHDSQALESLRVYISRLRHKIGNHYIVTVRGGGYVLANISSF